MLQVRRKRRERPRARIRNGAATAQPDDVLIVPVAHERNRALRVRRIGRGRLFPPEDPAVVIDLAQQPELMNVPHRA